MAFDPKPITVEYVSPEEYDGAQDPQPFVVVGEAPGGDAPVTSVNGATGAVVLDAEAVGALPDDYTPPAPTWGSVTGKPSTFAPAAHTHAIEDVTGLQAIITDLTSRIEALESAGA